MAACYCLTGGPGGSKTALIRALAADPAWCDRFLALPEAISVAGQTGISPREPLFQRLMVEGQRGLEDAVARALEPDDRRIILCHRGTLDPLRTGWTAAGLRTSSSHSPTRPAQSTMDVTRL